MRIDSKVEFIRGETEMIRFQRFNDAKEIITDNPTQIYFSFKKRFEDNTYLFQKSLLNGIIRDGDYWIATINPSDTISLEPGLYVFDVKVVTPFYSRYVIKPQQCDLKPNVTGEY